MVSPNLQIKKLRRASTPEEFKLYRAALEWDLTEPIIIENRKDLRSERDWKEKVSPYNHQVTNLITFCRRLPVTLLADDVGLGKTISAGLVMSELMARGRVSKILVVCPKLLMPQWKEELETKFGIESIEATGRELASVKPPEEGGAVITTYHSARLHFDAIAKAGFEMLVLDEAHKLRNLYGVDNPPQVAIRIRKALADRQFKYVLMLTATPIHNRLWDLYSLIDLLTVARGHENPFGTVGMFARNFIADNRTTARQLKPDKRDEFRSIVYSYMSRIRRADAKLYFPDRKVQLHKVTPTIGELELISIVSKYIQKLNPLSQYSLLLALTSSPQALASQLRNMAKNGTAPASFFSEIKAVVDGIGATAKLQGLITLINELKKEQSDHWRMVIFTESRETQTTIESFLSELRISCGLINGDSASRNQQTIEKFKTSPPQVHVIISTRAGSEGVNLQVANVLVNYDLPWNPMIVEQRIGRVQRLASAHASVCIFNMILQGTFEEYIVGRLMEKLQLASHAVGDVESLLEAAGMDDDDSDSFEEKIRHLVLAALAGKNTEQATLQTEQSIAEARVALAQEEQNINQMLGGAEGAIDLGPRSPKFPPVAHSMDAKSFALSALESLGAKITQKSSDSYEVLLDGRRQLISFEPSGEATLCMPGRTFFESLVNRILVSGLHQIEDLDQKPLERAHKVEKSWVDGFKGNYISSRPEQVSRCFKGAALLRVRTTVAHDSYERLVEVPCESEGPQTSVTDPLTPITNYLDDPTTLRLPSQSLRTKALENEAISEFCRFYQERLIDEVKATGQDERKRKKIEDDFTPRLEVELVGLEGTVHRELENRVSYKIDEHTYQSALKIIPSTNELIKQPDMETCFKTGVLVPSDCLGNCAITRVKTLKHLLDKSEVSGRTALPEHFVVCAFSGKRVLSDEVELSAVTEKKVATSLMKTSALSGKRAEPNFFSKCEITSAEVLQSELAVSQISGKKYRVDEQLQSSVSSKTAHKSEFVACAETGQALFPSETQKCELTGRLVAPGVLEQCEISGKKVVPSELEKCPVSGKKALRKFFISSSLSGVRVIEQEAVRSLSGRFCLPSESRLCVWSGRKVHPEDLKTCELTGAEFHSDCLKTNGTSSFEKMSSLLDGNLRTANKTELWDDIATKASVLFRGGQCRIESAEISPNSQCLAASMEVKTWLGMKVRHAGVLYSIPNKEIVGRTRLGKRNSKGWQAE